MKPLEEEAFEIDTININDGATTEVLVIKLSTAQEREREYITFLEDLNNRINAGYSNDDIKTLIGQEIQQLKNKVK